LISTGDLNLRQVALAAGVTPPLAHYYFGNREGLLRALVDERVRPDVVALLDAAQRHAGRPTAALTRLMQHLASLAYSNRLAGACLLLPAAHALRAQLRGAMRELLQAAQDAGQLRQDLPASYLAETLLALCVLPVLDAGSRDAATQTAASLTLHNVALLQHGIRAPGGQPS